MIRTIRTKRNASLSPPSQTPASLSQKKETTIQGPNLHSLSRIFDWRVVGPHIEWSRDFWTWICSGFPWWCRGSELWDTYQVLDLQSVNQALINHGPNKNFKLAKHPIIFFAIFQGFVFLLADLPLIDALCCRKDGLRTLEFESQTARFVYFCKNAFQAGTVPDAMNHVCKRTRIDVFHRKFSKCCEIIINPEKCIELMTKIYLFGTLEKSLVGNLWISEGGASVKAFDICFCIEMLVLGFSIPYLNSSWFFYWKNQYFLIRSSFCFIYTFPLSSVSQVIRFFLKWISLLGGLIIKEKRCH